MSDSYDQETESHQSQNHRDWNHSPRNSPQEHDRDARNTVFVGNLSWNVKWQNLKDHMRQLGGHVIRADVFTSPDGYSRGCGIVEYSTAEEAQQAIKMLDNTELLNRRIVVREDRKVADSRGGYQPNYDRHRSGRNRSPMRHQQYHSRESRHRRNYDNQPESRDNNMGSSRACQIHVGNLPSETTWQMLKDYFNENRVVRKANVYESKSHSDNGPDYQLYGIVSFFNSEEAASAVEKFNNAPFLDNIISVRPI